MSFRFTRDVLLAWAVLGICDGCSAEVSAQAKLAALSEALEESCAEAVADVAGDVLAILPSIEPLDPAVPQAYGSEACGGVVFEFENPNAEPLHGAWVQAGGFTREDSDALSESRCSERALQADYWGYKDKVWTKLAAADESAAFISEEEHDAGYCKLEALMLQEGTFEKLRVVARVTQDSETYPMHALVW